MDQGYGAFLLRVKYVKFQDKIIFECVFRTKYLRVYDFGTNVFTSQCDFGTKLCFCGCFWDKIIFLCMFLGQNVRQRIFSLSQKHTVTRKNNLSQKHTLETGTLTLTLRLVYADATLSEKH